MEITLHELAQVLSTRKGYTLKLFVGNRSIEKVLLPVNIEDFFREVFEDYPLENEFRVKLFSERGILRNDPIKKQYIIKRQVMSNQNAPAPTSTPLYGVPMHQVPQSAEAFILNHTKERLNEVKAENKELSAENKRLERENFAQERELALIKDKHALDLKRVDTEAQSSLSGVVDKVAANDQLSGLFVQVASKLMGNEAPTSLPVGQVDVSGNHQDLKTMVVDFIDQLSDKQAVNFEEHLMALAPKLNEITRYTAMMSSEEETV